MGVASVKAPLKRGAPGRKDDFFPRRFHRDADRRLADVVGADVPLFEPQWDLAGNGEQFELNAWQWLELFTELDGAARRNVAVDHVEHAIGPDRIQRRLGAE